MQALEPILEDVLVVGGWAHRLHREHPLADASDEAPVQTSDCDIVFGLKSPAPQGLDLQVRFRLAGFDYEHTGTELQESGVFRSRTDPAFTVQLLVPRRGSGTTRAGDPFALGTSYVIPSHSSWASCFSRARRAVRSSIERRT